MTERPTSRTISRDGVLVEGDDAVSWLQGQVSQDLDGMGDGESRLTLVLSPQGKVDSFARVTQLSPTRVLLDVERGHGEELLARLSRFKLRVKARLELTTVTCEEELGGGFDGLGPPRISEADVADAHESGEDEAFEAARIRAKVPRLGRELTGRTIPQEAGDELIARTVSFTKGCYTGQELVARLDSRGAKVPRSIRLIQGEGPLPRPGEAVLSEGDEVGTVTSSAHDGDRRFVALVLLRRAFLESGTLALEVATAEGVVPAVLAENGGG